MNQLQEEILKVLIEFDKICKQHDIPYGLYGGTHLGAVRHKGYIPWDDDVDIVVTREDFIKLDKILKDKNNLPQGYYYHYVEYTTRNAISTPKLRSTTMDIAERLPKTQKRFIGPWVDIFIWDNVPDTQEEQRTLFNKLKRIDLIIFVLLYVQYDPNRTGIVNIMKGIVQKINEVIHPLYFFVPYLLRKRDRIAQSYNNQETSLKGANCYAFYRDFEEYMTQVVPKEYLNDFVDYDFEGLKFPSYEKYDELLTIYYNDYMTLPDEADQRTHNIDY